MVQAFPKFSIVLGTRRPDFDALTMIEAGLELAVVFGAAREGKNALAIELTVLEEAMIFATVGPILRPLAIRTAIDETSYIFQPTGPGKHTRSSASPLPKVANILAAVRPALLRIPFLLVILEISLVCCPVC